MPTTLTPFEMAGLCIALVVVGLLAFRVFLPIEVWERIFSRNDLEDPFDSHRCRLYQVEWYSVAGTTVRYTEAWDTINKPLEDERPDLLPEGVLVHTETAYAFKTVKRKIKEYRREHNLIAIHS